MLYKDHFEFKKIEESKTDIALIQITDKRTSFVVKTALSRSDKQTPSIMAFAGARYSRSNKPIEDILGEVKQSGKNAQEKLANIFKNYGHASVADMAQLFLYIENIPMMYAEKFFNETSLGGGQARSTRYQDFGNLEPEDLNQHLSQKQTDSEYTELDQEFKNYQQKSLSLYSKWVTKLTDKYTQVYGVDSTNKRQISALKARVFDSARFFLVSGLANRTSLAWVTSAREWARLISVFKSLPEKQMQYLAEQIEALLAPDPQFAESIDYLPEAPDLIRYTSADETNKNNLTDLKNHLEKNDFQNNYQKRPEFGFHQVDTKLYDHTYSGSIKAIAQNIISIYPEIDPDWLFSYLMTLDVTEQKNLGKVITQDYNHHQQMSNSFRVNTSTFVLTCSIGETRDLDRHRAWGRFVPMLNIQENYEQILDHGYCLPLYLTENPELESELQEFDEDLLTLYKDLFEFTKKAFECSWFDRHILLQMLPFAHIMEIWMHGSPKEISYITKLRVRPGGHINYRELAWQMAKTISDNDPFLANLEIKNRPDPTSKAEFLDRS